MIKLQVFPQIIRIFSATLLWLTLITLITVNTMNVSGVSTDVLGVFSSYQEERNQRLLESKKAREDYHFWQGVVREKPDYRDAYITLAALAYQLSKPEEAKEYLVQATSLDPNSQIVEKLSSLLP